MNEEREERRDQLKRGQGERPVPFEPTQTRPLTIERQVVRAILLTPEQEVLLLRYRLGDDCFWITPGGGLEAGETIEDGLRRELREELGLEDFQIGPLVWRRRRVFNRWRRIYQSERYYVVHVARFEPRMSDTADVYEAKWLSRFRWWSVTELAQTSEPLRPLSLAKVVARCLGEGLPEERREIT